MGHENMAGSFTYLEQMKVFDDLWSFISDYGRFNLETSKNECYFKMSRGRNCSG